MVVLFEGEICIMSDSSKEIHNLSFEEKRVLLAQLLKKQAECSKVFPLSFEQQRLWFFNQLAPDSPFYNIPYVVHLEGQLQVVALEQSINEIVRRHEALRTTFIVMNGEPKQAVASTLTLMLLIEDLTDFSGIQQEQRIQDLINQEAALPFDLTRGPLLRTTLLRLNEVKHILLLTQHHIISDGWSIGIFFRELAAFYKAFFTGIPSLLPELPIQYVDYAVWQRQWLQGETLKTQLDYWRRQLSGIPPLLELPTDHPRPAIQTYQGARLSFELSKPLFKALQIISQQEGVTLFMLLLATFQTLLYRYTNQGDLVVGSPIAGRTQTATENLIGFFVNTLVLRTNLSANLSFRDLLKRVREVALEAYDHQHLPFERLVEELHPERSLSYNPLFQVMFTFQSTPTESLKFSDLTMHLQEGKSGTAQFDLTLEITENINNLIGTIEYNTDLFEATTITRMVEHLRILLENIVVNPGMVLGKLPLLTDTEHEQLCTKQTSTPLLTMNEQCIHQMFEIQAANTPTGIAVTFEEEYLTYQELNKKSNQLAHYLQKKGVGPETRVAICAERSLELIIGILGILKAGGAYVPLDPNYPKERLVFIIQDAQVPIILTQHRLTTDIPQCNAQIICLDQCYENIDEQSSDDIDNKVTGANIAYLIYTSGSTGEPKGVLIQHRSLVSYVQTMKTEYKINAKDRVLQFASISFDISVEEIFTSLTCGATLILRSDSMLNSVSFFLQKCQEWSITVLDLPTAYWHEIAAKLDAERVVVPSSLRLVIIGGEKALIERMIKWQKHVGEHVRLINTYGPTEGTIVATLWEVEKVTNIGNLLLEIPIGRAIPNVQVYVLDKFLQAVPIGVPGELYIGGNNLARGYLNRPSLTAERFVPNPFSSEVGARLYRTGDVVRRRLDGNIEFIGRIDTQVKIRGYRIELAEVESALRQHALVKETVVLAREDAPGEKRLIAYVVPNPGMKPSMSKLRSHMETQLPSYMIPSIFVMLDKLLLSPNGKVDIQALPMPDMIRPELEEAYVAPRNSTEKVVSEIWAEILGIECVGIYDNFFELGGHSLLATQIVSRIRETFQENIPLRSIFEFPTVAKFAKSVEVTHTKQIVQAPPLLPAPQGAQIPISFPQESTIRHLNGWKDDKLFYNMFEAVHLIGPLNIRALEQTLNEIVRRHAVFRTNFANVRGRLIQTVSSPIISALPTVDLSLLSKLEQEAQVLCLAAEEAEFCFDLSQDLLLRSSLLELNEEEHVLLLTTHHIASDDWSMKLLFQEISVLYEAFSKGKASPLSELPIQYADFAYWQRQWLQGSALESQLSYWKRQLNNCPEMVGLPTDYGRPNAPTFSSAYQSLNLSVKLTKGIKALSLQESVTLFMTLLAAFKTLLYYYTGQHDVIVGTPIANRNRVETETLIGFFAHSLLLRTDLSGNPTFREVLVRVREVTLEAYAHQDLHVEVIMKTLQLDYLYRIKFAFQDNSTSKLNALNLQGISSNFLHIEEDKTIRRDLCLEIREEEKELKVVVLYNKDLFKASTVTRMLRDIKVLLESIIDNPDQRLFALKRSVQQSSSMQGLATTQN